jgi:enoyl-CoA hydratase/carnithine racemase
MTETYEELRYSRQDGVATVTLDRPERLNAWTLVMETNVKRALLEAAQDESVRAIVLTGAGRGFCAGADMRGLQSASNAGVGSLAQAPERQRESPASAVELEPPVTTPYPGRFGYMVSIGKPIVAAINGPCAGIGLVLTLFCDLRFASDQAMFTTAFAQRGLIAEHGSSWLLPRLVGPSRALDLLLSARRVPATEAVQLGLINGMFPHATFASDIASYVRRLTHEVSPRSLAVMKAQIWSSLAQTFGDSLTVADREMTKSFQSADFKEGVAHFVEKRAPRFTGQ